MKMWLSCQDRSCDPEHPRGSPWTSHVSLWAPLGVQWVSQVSSWAPLEACYEGRKCRYEHPYIGVTLSEVGVDMATVLRTITTYLLRNYFIGRLPDRCPGSPRLFWLLFWWCSPMFVILLLPSLRSASNHLNERECENMSKSEQKKETKVCIEGPIR